MHKRTKSHWWMRLDGYLTAMIIAIITSVITSTVLTVLICTKWRWLLELL